MIKRSAAGRGGDSAGRTRVLVTGGEHTGPLAAVRALRIAGYEPWVGASRRNAYAARSRASAGAIVLPDSRANPDAFIEGLRASAEKLGLAVILSGTEADLVAMARGRERLGPLAVATPDLAEVLRITNKRIVYEIAAGAGVRIPSTIELDRADLLTYDGVQTPLIVKPLRSELHTSDRGVVHSDVHRVDTENELQGFATAVIGERWLLQSYLKGRLGAICGVAWKGEIVCAVHQMAQRTWPVDVGVSSYAQTVGRDSVLEAGVARLIVALDWSGIFQAQFIHTEEGPYLIDLNPRVYGSLALAIAAGANLPAIWVALLTGSTVQVPTYRVGVRYRSEELDVRALLHLLCSGDVAGASLGLIPRRHTTHAVARLADPLPMLTSLAKLRRRLTFDTASPGARVAS